VSLGPFTKATAPEATVVLEEHDVGEEQLLMRRIRGHRSEALEVEDGVRLEGAIQSILVGIEP
jgi:hypothetical protein